VKHACTTRERARWRTLALVVAAAACDGDDGAAAPTPTIGVVVATPALSVRAGQNATTAVTVSRGGGTAGA
jgi:hypothetical protein